MKRFGLCVIVLFCLLSSISKSNADILDMELIGQRRPFIQRTVILTDSVSAFYLDQAADAFWSCRAFLPEWFCMHMSFVVKKAYLFIEDVWPDEYEKLKLAKLGEVTECKSVLGKKGFGNVGSCVKIGNIVSGWKKVKFNVHYAGLVGVDPFLRLMMEYAVPTGNFDPNDEEPFIHYSQIVYLQSELCELSAFSVLVSHGSAQISIPTNAVRAYVKFEKKGRRLELLRKEDCSDGFCFKDEYTVRIRSEMSFSRYPENSCMSFQEFE